MRRARGGNSSIFNEKTQDAKERKNYTMPKSDIKRSGGQQSYKYYVGPGNNSSLVRKILSTRKNWQQMDDPKYLFLNLKWQQTNRGYKYENCIDNRILKQSLNHLQFHHQLSNKENLLRNLTDYCEHHKLNVFDFVPVTFSLNLSLSNFDQQQNLFLKFFEFNLPEHMKKANRKFWLNLKRKHTIVSSVDRKVHYFHSKPEIQNVFLTETSNYLWILKPTFYNRGNGIHVFNQISKLQELINQYVVGFEYKTNNQSSPQIKSKGFRIRQTTSRAVIRTNSFIVQKYLQRPLLIAGRKFDIRMWVLFSHQFKVYLFTQGYLRTSSYAYSCNQNTINDQNIHLTNNAVQKNNKQYGKYEDGNQLSFKHLEDVVERAGGDYTALMNQIKKIVKITALSVRKKINRMDRLWCFEIFGYDFMVDAKCKPWLIQVNTNPCLQQSSLLLQQLLPRMLDDAFCLVLDKVFPSSKNSYNYTMKNESNSQNLWELIVDLKK